MALDEAVWPVKSRELETRLMDSHRWNDFKFREGDIVVDTWADEIAAQRLTPDCAHWLKTGELSPDVA